MKPITTARKYTKIDSRGLAFYLNTIDDYKILTPEEEIELGKEIQEGNEYAREKLINHNLRFVVTCAKHYQNKGVPLEDLIEEGNIGLMIAADKWDYKRKTRFITCALWWIRQRIINALNKTSRTIKLPQNITNVVYRMNRYGTIAEQKAERELSNREMATVCKCHARAIQTAKNALTVKNSLDAPIPNCDNESLTLSDVLPSFDNIEVESREETINQILHSNILSDIERIVLMNYFDFNGAHYTLQSIGLKYCMSATRTKKIKDKALVKLKKYFPTILKELYYEQ